MSIDYYTLDNAPNTIGVYLIESPSGKCYVGMTCDSFKKRWRGHLKELKSGKHRTPGLRHSYQKYGWEAFKLIILEEWSKSNYKIEDIEELQSHILKRERYWWEQLTLDGVKLLNGCPTGTGSVLHTKESRSKISETSLRNNLKNKITKSCKFCYKEFIPKRKTRLFCSKECCNVSKIGLDIKALPDEKELYKLYWIDDLATRSIATIYNISASNVCNLMKYYNIPLRRRKA